VKADIILGKALIL